MKRKPIIAATVTAALALSLTACGGAPESEDELNLVPATQATDTTAATTTAAPVTKTTKATTATTKPEPIKESNTEWFDSFVKHMKNVEYRKATGIADNGTAFWKGSKDGRDGFFLCDMDTQEVNFVRMDNGLFYDNKLYGYVYDSSSGTIFTCYDMFGNRIAQLDYIKEIGTRAGVTHGSFGGTFHLLTDGSFFFKGDVGRKSYFYFLVSPELTITAELPKLVIDIGHGKTEEKEWDFIGELDGVLFVFGNGKHYTLDMETHEFEESEAALRSGFTFYSKYAVSNNDISDLVTHETVRLNAAFEMSNFTGENYYKTDSKTISKVVPVNVLSEDKTAEKSEVVFEAPNNSEFWILSDEYIILKDFTGTYLYKMVKGDTAGELVFEIMY